MRKQISEFVEKYRFKLLLIFTLIFLVVPSYFKSWFFYEFITFFSLSFVFVQSMFIITAKNKKYNWVVAIFVLVLFFTWFEVFFERNFLVELFRFLLYVVFFVFTILSLFRFVIKAKRVTMDVIIVAIVVYLVLGILGGSGALFFNNIYPDAYTFNIPREKTDLLEMLYYGFVTMSTLGYGDITPARPETRTFAYLLAVAGQLYVAIVIAFIVGKYISHESSRAKEE